MSTYVSGFQSFFRGFLHLFVSVKLFTNSIRVEILAKTQMLLYLFRKAVHFIKTETCRHFVIKMTCSKYINTQTRLCLENLSPFTYYKLETMKDSLAYSIK